MAAESSAGFVQQPAALPAVFRGAKRGPPPSRRPTPARHQRRLATPAADCEAARFVLAMARVRFDGAGPARVAGPMAAPIPFRRRKGFLLEAGTLGPRASPQGEEPA